MLQLQLPQTCNFLPHPEQPPSLQPLESGLSCSGWRKPNFSNPDMSGAHGALSMPSRPDIYPYQNAGMDQRQLNHPGYGFNSFNHRQSLSQASSRPTSRPASPVFQAASLPDQSSRGRLSSSNSVASYLQLPPTIAHGKPGSLAEFAAQITCLFWFETTTTLESIEESPQAPLPAAPLGQEAIPVTGFLKWVTTILTTTQVTQNVVLLALLFVYRLKKQNPLVKGKPGSEYRLLTVALMLGNKFLDDNTYTNKTWAEVSGISVHEIHVMEVEFLSHMKYNLYVSKEEWDDWHQQLGKFWTYFDRAARKSAELASRQASNMRSTALQIPYALPSPPHSNAASPPYGSSAAPNNFNYPTPTTSLPYHPGVSISPVGSMSEYDGTVGGRKRSWDETVLQEPQPKRQHTRHLYQNPSKFQEGPLPTLPTLPMPNLPMPTTQYTYPTPVSGSSQSQPSFPSGRSTPGPFPPPANWLQAVFPSGTSNSPASAPVPSQGYANRAMQGDILARYQTPGALSNDGSLTMHPSTGSFAPLAAHGVSHSQLSPSHFLNKRSSPYKPVRNISTLLVPPPSNQMSYYPANISYDQMQWQPLSKNPNEYDRRTGRVPYLHREAWPQTHQFEQWPAQYIVN